MYRLRTQFKINAREVAYVNISWYCESPNTFIISEVDSNDYEEKPDKGVFVCPKLLAMFCYKETLFQGIHNMRRDGADYEGIRGRQPLKNTCFLMISKCHQGKWKMTRTHAQANLVILMKLVTRPDNLFNVSCDLLLNENQFTVFTSKFCFLGSLWME